MEIFKPTIQVSSSGPIHPRVGYLRLSFMHSFGSQVNKKRTDMMVIDFKDGDFNTSYNADKGILIT